MTIIYPVLCPTCGVEMTAYSVGLDDLDMEARGLDPSVRVGPSTAVAEPCGHPIVTLIDGGRLVLRSARKGQP